MRLDVLAGMARFLGVMLIIVMIEIAKHYEPYNFTSSLIFSSLAVVSIILLGLRVKE